MTNVDFENTEAWLSMAYSEEFPIESGMELGLTDKFYEVPGIITAIPGDNATENNNDAWSKFNVPSPRGRFIWNGGSVVGHNIDMNPIKI